MRIYSVIFTIFIPISIAYYQINIIFIKRGFRYYIFYRIIFVIIIISRTINIAICEFAKRVYYILMIITRGVFFIVFC